MKTQGADLRLSSNQLPHRRRAFARLSNSRPPEPQHHRLHLVIPTGIPGEPRDGPSRRRSRTPHPLRPPLRPPHPARDARPVHLHPRPPPPPHPPPPPPPPPTPL